MSLISLNAAHSAVTVSAEQLTAMTVADIQALPLPQLQEVQTNLAQLADWLKASQAKVHTAMQRRWSEPEVAARQAAGKDFGVIHLQEGGLRISVDVPKRVSWDQQQLAAIAQRIAAAGERVQDYLNVEYAIPEARFNNWPEALKSQFASARTVKPGKASYAIQNTEE